MEENNIKLRNIYLRFKGGILDFKGVSMEPTFRDGDKVKVEPVEAENIKVGDIIVFDKDILVCHRILGRFKKDGKIYFWEKGDNSNGIGYVSEDEIIGRAAYILVEKGKIKKPDFYFNKKVILLYLLETIIYPYTKIAGLIKKYLFFGKKNLFSHILGTTVWKVYYFCFSVITKKNINI